MKVSLWTYIVLSFILTVSLLGSKPIAYGQEQPTIPTTQNNTASSPMQTGPDIEGNKSEPMRWLTYEDPILQFSIEYPSTWSIYEYEDHR
jgi:hypothetical protein